MHESALHVALSFVSLAACEVLALLVIARATRQRVHWTLAAALAALGITHLGNGMSLLAASADDLLLWRRVAIAGEILMPFNWLLFSVVFARADERESLREWKPILGLGAGLTAGFLGLLGSDAFVTVTGIESGSVRFGLLGRTFAGVYLVAQVLILANLEQTFRHADEQARWYLKFPVVGVGLVSMYFLYEMSDLLLYLVWHRELAWLSAMVSTVSCALIGYGLVHRATPDVHIYVSKKVVSSSLTFLLVGGVLMGTGLIAWFIRGTGLPGSLVLSALFMLLAGTGLVFVLLSAHARQTLGRFVERHFFAHTYDYRTRWLEVTETISAPGTAEQIAARAATLCKSLFGARTVAIWMSGHTESDGWVRLAGLPPSGSPTRIKDGGEIGRWLNDHPDTIETPLLSGPLPAGLVDEVRGAGAVLLAPLRTGNHAIGWAMLGRRADGRRYSQQDRDLLRCVSAQVADRLQHLALAERLILAREMEGFYECSAFFLHDLKNFIATLSLVVQNAERHGENPEFQRAAMATIGSTVRKMTALMGTVAALSRDPCPKLQVVDLNALIDDVLKGFEYGGGAPLIRHAKPVPLVRVDPDQLQQVVLNLILNAQDAVGRDGRIVITTDAVGDRAQVMVEDNGCGMEEETIAALFRPFRSTKGRGLGIGLYQCRKILQAHGGTLEVESEKGKGTRFIIRLHRDRGEGARTWVNPAC